MFPMFGPKLADPALPGPDQKLGISRIVMAVDDDGRGRNSSGSKKIDLDAIAFMAEQLVSRIGNLQASMAASGPGLKLIPRPSVPVCCRC